MASIFRATDLHTGRQVAIKVPHPEMESDPVFFERFRREEEIGKKLDHPGVMKVFTEDGRSQLYMVMEWVEGRLLRQILNEQRKLPAERAVRIALHLCGALDYIHSHGVVHRDLKPENIMVDAEDRVKPQQLETLFLPPGNYAIACWQTGKANGQPGDGPPHASLGMVAQFTVT